MKTDFDIVIVGAGMVGAAIANGLASTGLSIAIIDQARPHPYDPDTPPQLRVSAISYTSEQFLRNIGAWANIESKRLCPYRRLGVWELKQPDSINRSRSYSASGQASSFGKTLFKCDEVNKSHLGHIIENHVIQNGLKEAMLEHKNISLLCPCQIKRFDRKNHGTQLHLEGGKSINCQLLIGADGAQSRVRQWAGIGQFREQYAQQAMVITVEYEGHQEDITWQAFTPDGPRAFLPLADQGEHHFASLVWYDDPQRIRHLRQMQPEQLRKEIPRCFPPELPNIIRIIETGSFPLAKSHAHHYATEGVVLAGDAAHTINPLAGQGVNLGFQDAAELVEVIAQCHLKNRDISRASNYLPYEKKRKTQNAIMMNAMDVFYYAFSNKLAPVKLLRQIGLSIAQHAGPLKRQVLQHAIGITDELPRIARLP